MIFLCWCLLQCLISGFRCHLLLLPMESQPLEFSLPQPFVIYPWQACVPPDTGPWSTLGVHWVAALSTALSRGLHATQLSSSHFINMVGHTALGTQQSHLTLPLPYMMGRGLCFQVFIHLMRRLTQHLWGA